MEEAKPSRFTEAELALFRELEARSVKYYVGGLCGAALLGAPVAWSQIGLYAATHGESYTAAIRAARIPTDAMNQNRTDARIREVVYRAEGRFHAQHAAASIVVVGTTPIRVQSLDGIRDDIDSYFGGWDEEALVKGLSKLPPGQRPESVITIATDIGMLIGPLLQRAEAALSSAGYVQSRSRRAGTYELDDDGDVNPRTGERSAGIVVYEHPSRPVVAAVRRAIGGG